LIGLAVFSSDGNKVGMVDSIDAQPDGKITAIHIKTGGFLGFGA
jgi:sporulation protein YlmC with PRC-barrel domain